MVSDILITIKVKPNASENRITGWETDENNHPILKISVTATPEKGKANKAVLALLSKHWKIPKTSMSIVKGETEKIKILSVPQIPNDYPET